MNKEDYLNGQVLLIDKPLEWTSFQAVNKIRWHNKQKFGLKKNDLCSFELGHVFHLQTCCFQGFGFRIPIQPRDQCSR